MRSSQTFMGARQQEFPNSLTSTPAEIQASRGVIELYDDSAFVPASICPEDQRKRSAVQSCRRCREVTCPGNNDILNRPWPCKVPCKICGGV